MSAIDEKVRCVVCGGWFKPRKDGLPRGHGGAVGSECRSPTREGQGLPQKEGVWTVATAGSLNGDGLMGLCFFTDQADALDLAERFRYEGTDCIVFEGKPEWFSTSGHVQDEHGHTNYLHSLRGWLDWLRVKQSQKHKLLASDDLRVGAVWYNPAHGPLIGFYDEDDDAFHYVLLSVVKRDMEREPEDIRVALSTAGGRQVLIEGS